MFKDALKYQEKNFQKIKTRSRKKQKTNNNVLAPSSFSRKTIKPKSYRRTKKHSLHISSCEKMIFFRIDESLRGSLSIGYNFLNYQELIDWCCLCWLKRDYVSMTTSVKIQEINIKDLYFLPIIVQKNKKRKNKKI